MVGMNPRVGLFRSILVVYLVLGLALGLAFPPSAFSDQGTGPEPDRLLGFARHLAGLGLADKAETEYLRFLHLHPGHQEAARAVLELALVQLSLNQPQRALSSLARLAPEQPPGIMVRGTVLAARAQAALGREDEAESLLLALAGRPALPEAAREEALYALGWFFLEQGRFKEAGETFSRIGVGGELGVRAAFLAKEAPKGEKLDKRSPVLAGLLSALLPGLGQALQGHWTDAGWAAGLSLVPGALSYLAWGASAWATCGLTGLAALAFYGGNIYNAVNLAHRDNQASKDRFLAGLKTQAPPPWGPGLSPSSR